jgi:hypothetical protein
MKINFNVKSKVKFSGKNFKIVLEKIESKKTAIAIVGISDMSKCTLIFIKGYNSKKQFADFIGKSYENLDFNEELNSIKIKGGWKKIMFEIGEFSINYDRRLTRNTNNQVAMIAA